MSNNTSESKELTGLTVILTPLSKLAHTFQAYHQLNKKKNIQHK